MNYCDFIDDILVRTASYLSPKDLVNLGLTCTRFGSSQHHINNLSLVEDTAKQMIETTTTTEMEREAVYPFYYQSWMERWYMLENSDNSNMNVTFIIKYYLEETRITMKKWQRMDKITIKYCDCKRGGVRPEDLSFMLNGGSIWSYPMASPILHPMAQHHMVRHHTAFDLNLEDDDIIDC